MMDLYKSAFSAPDTGDIIHHSKNVENEYNKLSIPNFILFKRKTFKTCLVTSHTIKSFGAKAPNRKLGDHQLLY
jgi:hypothetical protein